jgi:hypothetical protein
MLDRWPQLPRLKHLDLSKNNLPPACSRGLLGGGRLTSLTHLGVQSSRVSESMESLTRPGALPALKSLDATNSMMTPDALDLLGGSELLGGLEVLKLRSTDLRAEHVQALTRHGRTGRLRHLDLSYNDLRPSPDTTAALASAPLGSLRSLDLSVNMNTLNASDLRILAASPWLAGLRSLKLSGRQIGDEGAKALARSPHLTGLTELSLESAGIGPSGAASLAAWPGLSQVRKLNLSGNPLGPEGVEALAASPHLGSVEHLLLGTTDLGDRGVRALAASPNLANLRHLNLWLYHSPDDSALRELANSARLPRLLILKVQVVMYDSPKELQDLGRTIVV